MKHFVVGQQDSQIKQNRKQTNKPTLTKWLSPNRLFPVLVVSFGEVLLYSLWEPCCFERLTKLKEVQPVQPHFVSTTISHYRSLVYNK